MQEPLRRLARAVAAHPVVTLLILLLVTVGLASRIPEAELTNDSAAFAPDTEEVAASNEISDRFEATSTATLQVVVPRTVLDLLAGNEVVAILAPERLDGEFADFPTARERGVDAIGANWRGFYAPGGMSDEAYNTWVSKISDLYASDAWKEVMAANGLAPLDLQGDAFQSFVSDSVAQIQTISREIGIIK